MAPMYGPPSATHPAIVAALAPITDEEIADALCTLMQVHDVLHHDIDQSTRRAVNSAPRGTSPGASNA